MVRVPGASLLIALVIVGCAGLPAGSKAPSPSSPGSPDPSLAASPWHSSVPSTVPTATPSAPPPIILQPLISPMSDPDFEVIVAARDGFVVLGRDGDRGVIARGDPGVGDWQLFDGSSAFGDGGSRIAISTKGWLAAGDRRPPGGSWSPDGSAWTAVRDLADLEAVVEVFAGEWGFAALGMTTDAQGTSVYPVWASRDGLAWQELQSVPGFRPQQVAILSDALVAIESSSLRSAVSVDGRTWSQPMSGPPVDDESGVSTARIAVVGDRLVGLSAGATGFAVFTGTVAPGGVAWYRVDGSEQFDGAMPTAMAGGPRGAVILGFDRTTLAPLVWLSTDGLTWTRSSPPRATFGGGVPTVVAVGSRAIVALGWDVSEYGEVRARAWSSTDGSTWVRDDSDALGRLPGPPSVGCPSTPPTDVAGLAAMLDENDDGREVWPFCFGDRDLSIEGYVQDCGGCGGLSDYLSSPTWLIDPLGYSAFWLGEIPNPEACDDPDGCTRIGAWVDPASPVEVPPAGTLVRVVGHFDDAASGTCRLIPSQGWMMPLPPAAETAATCRQHFVVTDIEVVVR